jgi:hypothetical protein
MDARDRAGNVPKAPRVFASNTLSGVGQDQPWQGLNLDSSPGGEAASQALATASQTSA